MKKRIFGTKERPRLSVYRSNKYIFAQLIDDKKSHSLAAASDKNLKEKGKTKIENAFKVGELIAQKALKKKIKRVVFDKGAYKYHGQIKALAEGARKKGLLF